MFTVVYLIGTFIFISMIVQDYTSLFGLIGTGFALGLTVSLWLKPRRAWKKLSSVLETMDEERYSAAFYHDRIEIETEILQSVGRGNPDAPENEDNGASGLLRQTSDETAENSDNKPSVPQKTEIVIATEELYASENTSLFILFVNRSLIYVFPKRCFSEEVADRLRDYFVKNGIY